MTQTTGSDTRMYAPRSESNLGYSKDEDYRHGIGDPKAMEEYRDKRQAEKEAETNSDDLPHLKIEVPKPAPEMPPMMPEEEEEEPMMDDQFNEGQQFGAMTGMPDMGNLSIGNATGTMPQPGGTLMTGEPMEDAWSELLKEDPDHEHDFGDGTDEDTKRYFDEEVRPEVMNPDTPRPYALMDNGTLYVKVDRMREGREPFNTDLLDEYNYRMVENDLDAQGSPVSDAGFNPAFQDVKRSEPMEDAWSTLMKGVIRKGTEDWHHDAAYELRHMAHSRGENMSYEDSYKELDKQHQDILEQLGHSEETIQNQINSQGFLDPNRNHDLWHDVMWPLKVDINSVYRDMEKRGELMPDEQYNHIESKIRSDFFQSQQNPQDIQTGEPIGDAWSTLMKGRLDNVKGAKDQSWKQPQYETQPGGADITTANTRRAKLQSRYVQPSKKRGLDRAPLSVHRTHLGIATKQPLRLFPQKYGQQMGSMARRKLMGNIPTTPAGHAMGPETTYSPKTPKVASGAGLPLKEPRAPMMRGQALAKAELKLIKQDLEELKKKQDYMHFTQIRRLLRQLKDAAERQESRLKASAGPGEVKESGHREGQDSTTRPEGATEDMENDPKNWGAPSTIFAARGSGRVG